MITLQLTEDLGSTYSCLLWPRTFNHALWCCRLLITAAAPLVNTPHQVWLLQLDTIFQVGDQCGAGTLADLVLYIMSRYIA